MEILCWCDLIVSLLQNCHEKASERLKCIRMEKALQVRLRRDMKLQCTLPKMDGREQAMEPSAPGAEQEPTRKGAVPEAGAPVPGYVYQFLRCFTLIN